ncbi:F-box protein [Zea mays]|nr:F-box protein [Zea mays]
MMWLILISQLPWMMGGAWREGFGYMRMEPSVLDLLAVIQL